MRKFDCSKRILVWTLAVLILDVSIIAFRPSRVEASDRTWKTIDGRKYLTDLDENLYSKTGIDVSKWQGNIDWDSVVSDDVHFAIIRIGHGHSENWLDTFAVKNMDACERLGIPYGVYFYSTAVTDDEASQEAASLTAALTGRNPSLGVFVDVEDTDAYKAAGIDPYSDGKKIVKFADIILNDIRKAGYIPGIYANTDYYDNVLYPASHFYSSIRWVARYYNYNLDHTDRNAAPAGKWDIWQYGSTGTVKGIEGNVDLDAMICDAYQSDYVKVKDSVSVSSGWTEDIESGWHYRKQDGTYYTGWNQIDGAWYYFDETGLMRTGSQNIGGTWYDFDDNGRMLTGWQKQPDGSWKYYYDSGALAQNTWVMNNDAWYYLGENGKMLTGWMKKDNAWYYLQGNGAMTTGWMQSGGTWYFFDDSGAMIQNRWEKTGDTWYYLDAGGAMATDWKKIGDNLWYYFAANGAMTENWQYINGTWYFFGMSGDMQQNRWLYWNDEWYYLTDSGAMAYGWNEIDSSWYYFTDSGAMVHDTWIGSWYAGGNGAFAAGR